MKRSISTLAAAGIFALTGAAVQAAPIGGLVAYYDFEGAGEEALEDKAGVHDNHLSNLNDLVTFVSDTSGAAGSTQVASFDGTGALYTGVHNDGVGTSSDLTLSFWMKGDKASQLDSQRRLAATVRTPTGDSSAASWTIEGFGNPNPKPGDGVFLKRSGTNHSSPTATTLTSPATWHHVAFVVKGGVEVQTWLDGVLLGSTALEEGVDFATVGGELVIGAERRDGHRGFVGLVDDFAIFNRALTQAEVEGIADGSIALAIPEPASLVLMGMGGLLILRRRK